MKYKFIGKSQVIKKVYKNEENQCAITIGKYLEHLLHVERNICSKRKKAVRAKFR